MATAGKCHDISISRQSGTRKLIASWAWCTTTTKQGASWDAHTDGYRIKWVVKYRKVSQKVIASDTTVSYNRDSEYMHTVNGVKYYGGMAEFTMPDDITAVWFKVLPYTEQEEEQEHYNGKRAKVSWASLKWTDVTDAPAASYSITTNLAQATASSMSGWKLTASISGIDAGDLVREVTDTSKWVGRIYFRFFRDEAELPKNGKTVEITSTTQSTAEATIAVDSGYEYKVRYLVRRLHFTRTLTTKTTKNGATITSYSDWEEVERKSSEWSSFSDTVQTVPLAPASIDKCYAKSTTSVFLNWAAVKGATSYVVEYLRDDWIGSNPVTHALFQRLLGQDPGVKSVSITDTSHTTILTGLETGHKYYFRIKAVNAAGTSYPTEQIVSTVLGVAPAAPTTWSSKSVYSLEDTVRFYWTHNASDDSEMSAAQVEVTVTPTSTGVSATTTFTITTAGTYYLDKTMTELRITEDATILWRACTKGVKDEYGDWSVQRSIAVHVQPAVSVLLTDYNGTTLDGAVEAFPLHLTTSLSPQTQTALSYSVSVEATEEYETYDNVGRTVTVKAGDQVFQQVFDQSEALSFDFTPGNISLADGETYLLKVMAATDAGLTTEEVEVEFTVDWPDTEYYVNASVLVDTEHLTASIRPICTDADDEPVEGLTFSIYRREFDGSFTEIATEVPTDTYVVDPHPALDYARYRIVGYTENGAILFGDPYPEEVQEKCAVIQWDETVTDFSVDAVDVVDEQEWSGSMVKLPYNLEVSDKGSPDAATVEYIGREHPVSYYGTQLGYTSTWTMSVAKDDAETLYALRRLQRWMGDAYVREPSGSGYWAHVEVQMKQSYKSAAVPVTLSITRVEGGV